MQTRQHCLLVGCLIGWLLAASVVTLNAQTAPATPPAAQMSGVILRPDGTPAAGAYVAMRDGNRMGMSLHDGISRRLPVSFGQAPNTQCDADGRFTLPAHDGKVRVCAMGEDGWVEFIRDGRGQGEQVTLRKWSRLEGRVLRGDKPWPNLAIIVSSFDPLEDLPSELFSARHAFTYETKTDRNGRFSFAHMLNGQLLLRAVFEPENDAADPRSKTEAGLDTIITIAAGEKRSIELGGVGRPVIGKIVIPADLKRYYDLPAFVTVEKIRSPMMDRPANPDKLTDQQKERWRNQHPQPSEPTRFAGMVDAHGDFRIDDVPPGVYSLATGIRDHVGGSDYSDWQVMAEKEITVGAIAEAKDKEPVDAGTLELQTYHPRKLPAAAVRDRPHLTLLDPGAAAPPLDFLGYDGKRVKLTDFRGKYVLLDFWATWCGPCIVEMKHLEEVQKQFANEPRLAMVSISVDEAIDEPRNFLKSRHMPWTHAWADTKDYRQFGFTGIPSIWLIDPDGKIISRGMGGSEIEAEIRKALGQ